MRHYFLLLFIFLFSWSTFKSYKYSSSLSKEIVASEEVLELKSKIEKVKAILSTNYDEKIIITDYEAKSALRDVSQMDKTVNSISNSYDSFHRTHIMGSNQNFLYNVFILSLFFLYTCAVMVINYGQNNKTQTNGFTSFINKIVSKWNQYQTERKSFSKVEKNSVALMVENASEVNSFQGKSIDEAEIKKFITSSLISGPLKSYSIETLTENSTTNFTYRIKSLEERALEVNYDLIPSFVNGIEKSFSSINPSIELSRDISSKELKFSIFLDTISSTGDFSHVQAS